MTEWTTGICNEKSGFLFSHACDRVPSAACLQCDKPVCEEHGHAMDEGVVCTSCRKKQYTRRGRRRRHRRDYHHYDDPYFYRYGGYGYGGYYRDSHEYDHNDFTEADGESLSHSGDEDFETDMMES